MPFLPLKRQRKPEVKGNQMPGEIVRDFRRNSVLLFIAGSPGLQKRSLGFVSLHKGK